MTAIAMDISEAALKFTELIVGLKRDEEIVITANNKPVARLLAAEDQAATLACRPIGLIEGPVWMSADFDEKQNAQVLH
jgi:prevent-host-death family protein